MGDDFLLGVEPPLPQVQGSPVRLASASSSPSVKMKVWKEKRALYRQPRVPAPAARRRSPRSPPRSGPLRTERAKGPTRVEAGLGLLQTSPPLSTAGPKVTRQLCRHEPGGAPRPPAR